MELQLAPLAKNYLREMLLKSAVLGEPIETDETTRGIGKSTALALFAKEYGLTVVVANRHHKSYLQSIANYDNIVEQKEIMGQPKKSRFVYDEGVDPSSLKGLNVVTGFYKLF